MRINEYSNLQEFIDEYDYESQKDCEKHIGLEFKYAGINYRMCCEPIPEKDLPILDDGKIGRYDVNIIHWKTDTEFEYELIGWYSSLEDLLNNCKIGDKSFKEIIMDDNTEITGKD